MLRNRFKRLLSLFLILSLLLPAFVFAAEEKQSTIQSVKIEILEDGKTDLKLGDKPRLRLLDENGNAYDFKNVYWTVNNESIAKIEGIKNKKHKDKAKLITLDKGKVTVTASPKDNPDLKDQIEFSIEDNIKTIFIRIEGLNETILPRTEMNIKLEDISESLGECTGSTGTEPGNWGVGKFNNPTVAHAIVHALTNLNSYNPDRPNMHQLDRKGGETDSNETFDFQDYGWSLYIAAIGEDREKEHGQMSGWMYRVNTELANVGAPDMDLQDGDDIVWHYAPFGFDNIYTFFGGGKDKSQVIDTVKVGEDLNIRLKGYIKTGEYYGQKEAPIDGATILVRKVGEKNFKEFKADDKAIKTQNGGHAKLIFDKSGEYELSAVRYKPGNGFAEGTMQIDIVRPIPVKINVDENKKPIIIKDINKTISKVEVSLLNINNIDMDSVVILKPIDENGRPYKVIYQNKVIPTGKSSVEFQLNLLDYSNGISKMQVYIWDSLEGMKPLAEMKVE